MKQQEAEAPAGASVNSKQIVYKGKIISVEVADVQLPHGPQARMEVVRHPGSCVIVAMPDPDRLILIRQYRYPFDRFLWELPAGSLKPGEDPKDGALRECAEEIGLIPAVVEEMGTYYPTPGYCDEYMKLFRMTGLRERGPDDPAAHQDADEHIEARTFSLEQARAMVQSGEIRDLKTAMTIALLANDARGLTS